MNILFPIVKLVLSIQNASGRYPHSSVCTSLDHLSPPEISQSHLGHNADILAFPGQNKAAIMEVPDCSYGPRLLPALHAALASSRGGHERTLTLTLVKILNLVIGVLRNA